MDLNLFKNKIRKENILTINGIDYDNSNIMGGVNFNQTVNIGTDITLGSCTASTIEFQLNNLNQLINNLVGKEITWKIRVETSPGVFEDKQMGIFIAEKPTKVNDTRMKVKAYDRMIKFDKIVDDWLRTISYPTTLKNMLTGLCNYVGVPLATTAFLNDNYPVKFNFLGTNVKGRDVLKWIAEIAAKFAVINELGQLRLGWYNSIVYSVNNSNYYDIKVEDYQVKKIDKLQVQVEENDIGVIVGIGTNAYVIQNNPLLYANTDAEIRPYVELIYNAIKDFTYIPFEIKVNANPLIKAGNSFQVTTRKGQVFNAVVMSRKMTSGNDVYSATGNANRAVNKSLNRSIQQLRGKTNVLDRTLERTISKLYDADTGDLTVLTQTVNSFSSRVQTIEANMNFRYQQDTPPENPEVGDIWFNTNPHGYIVDLLTMLVNDMLQPVDYYDKTLNKSYRWTGSQWEHIEDGAIAELRVNVSEMQQTVDNISLTVESYDGRIGTLELTANNLTSRITSAEGDIGELELTATTLTTRLTSAEGSISSIEQTVGSIATRVSNAEGNISTLQQTATSLTTRISSAEGNISTVTQTANNLTSRISSAEGNISTLEQTSSGITAAVNAAKLTFDSSGLTIKNGGFKILNGTQQVFYIESNGKLVMAAEFYNTTGSYGTRIANGRIEVSAGNSAPGPSHWGSVCGNVYGVYQDFHPNGSVNQLILEGINGAKLKTANYSAYFGVAYNNIYINGNTLNINGSAYVKKKLSAVGSGEYVLAAPS